MGAHRSTRRPRRAASTTAPPTSASIPRRRPTTGTWRGLRGTCRTCRGTTAGSSLADVATGATAAIVPTGAVQQPRWLSDGTLATVRDDDGWLNVWADGDAARGRAVRARRPVVGAGAAVVRRVARRTPAGVHPQRGRLRPVVRRRPGVRRGGRRRPRRPRAAVVGRRTARRAAHRRTHTDAGRRVRHGDVGAHGARRRAARGWEDARPGRTRAGRDHRPGRGDGARPAVHGRPAARAAVLGARRTDRPVAGDVPAADRLLAQRGLGRARTRSPRLHRTRPRLPTGDAAALGRARRRRRRRRHRTRPPAPGWADTGHDRRARRQRRRVHRARRGRGAPGPGRRRGGVVPGDRSRRSRRAQPPLRAALDDRARRRAARPRSTATANGRRSPTPSGLAGVPVLLLHGDSRPGRARSSRARGSPPRSRPRAATSSCTSIPARVTASASPSTSSTSTSGWASSSSVSPDPAGATGSVAGRDRDLPGLRPRTPSATS